jgi:hypothetical protein
LHGQRVKPFSLYVALQIRVRAAGETGIIPNDASGFIQGCQALCSSRRKWSSENLRISLTSSDHFAD